MESAVDNYEERKNTKEQHVENKSPEEVKAKLKAIHGVNLRSESL